MNMNEKMQPFNLSYINNVTYELLDCRDNKS